jgi:hypothetical protein
MDEVINCIKCGKPLQAVFFGIAHEFTGGVSVALEDESRNHWLVCTNPDCPDGSKNISHGVCEIDL